MKRRKPQLGVLWYLGTVQYCLVLCVGGALWFIAAQLTGFFWSDLPSQISASVLLLAVMLAESWWAHVPGYGRPASPIRDFTADLLTSASLVGFGMLTVGFISMWLRP